MLIFYYVKDKILTVQLGMLDGLQLDSHHMRYSVVIESLSTFHLDNDFIVYLMVHTFCIYFFSLMMLFLFLFYS